MIRSCWEFVGASAATAVPFAVAFIVAEVALYFLGIGRTCPKGDK
jgi:hypothetical protein